MIQENKEYLKTSPEIGIGVWYKLQTDFQDDGKKMSLIIADYIDGVNAILKKHKKEIQGASTWILCQKRNDSS